MNIIFKERLIFSKIIEQIQNDLILILIGARQVGKTFLLKMLIKYLKDNYSNSKILYFDLEKPDILGKFANYKSIIDFLLIRGIDKKNINFVLLDEFQKMPTPTKTLKIIHDHYPNLKIIATGSSSLEIYKKLRQESMAGRKRLFYIYPLEFEEFLNFSQNSETDKIYQRLLKSKNSFDSVTSDLIYPFEEYALFGGYPRVSLTRKLGERKEMIAEIYQSYLEKDITGLLKLEDTLPFTKLVSLVAVQIGNLFNLQEITKMINLSRNILDKYIYVLEQTFIIKLITPFYTNRQKEIIKMPKLYFIDLGLRNYAVHNFNQLELRQDRGQLIENAVFLELLKNLPKIYQIHFWRTPQGAEVDFVINHEEKPIPIEVKYQSFTKAVVPSGLKAFINHYSPSKAFVLTYDFFGKTKYSPCEIYFIPVTLTKKILSIIENT